MISPPPKASRESLDLSVPDLSTTKISNEYSSPSNSNDSSISNTSIENTKNIIVKPVKTPKSIDITTSNRAIDNTIRKEDIMAQKIDAMMNDSSIINLSKSMIYDENNAASITNDKNKDNSDQDNNNSNSNDDNCDDEKLLSENSTNVHLGKLYNEIRILRAQARVRAKERIEYAKEYKLCEDNWTTELTALRIRNNSVEDELIAAKDQISKFKIELADKDAQINILLTSKESVQDLLTNVKLNAEKDSLNSIISLKKFNTILESQRDQLVTQVNTLASELNNLRGDYEKSINESLEYKAIIYNLQEKIHMMNKVHNQIPPVNSLQQPQQNQQSQEKEKDATLLPANNSTIDNANEFDLSFNQHSSRRLCENEIDNFLARIVPSSVNTKSVFGSLYNTPNNSNNKNLSKGIESTLYNTRKKLNLLRSKH